MGGAEGIWADVTARRAGNAFSASLYLRERLGDGNNNLLGIIHDELDELLNVVMEIAIPRERTRRRPLETPATEDGGDANA
jgi:hypothetical protein